MRRVRWSALVVLLLALVGVAVIEGSALARGTTRLEQQTSSTSFRAAVRDGGTRQARAQGVPLRHRLSCANPHASGNAVAISCHGSGLDGRRVQLVGSTDTTDASPQQRYQLSVDGREVWAGSCLLLQC